MENTTFELREITDSHHGMVWEVPMTQDLGFSYVQTISMASFGQYGILVKILNYRSNVPYESKNTDFFKGFDFLTSPILGINPPPQRGEYKWKKIGYLDLLDEDLISPEFKGGVNLTLRVVPNEILWFIYYGVASCDTNEERVKYWQVKHLTEFGFTNLKFMRHRITMEWMKYLDMNYEKYETEDSPSFINIEDQKYFVKCGVSYSEVPKEIRGRAIRV
jgi:hypothetical protein